MKYGTFFVMRKLYRGQSLVRILMNIGFSEECIGGRVIDVGGGRKPDYFDYFVKAEVISIEAIDVSLTGTNFEKDTLPLSDGSAHTVICANVLEHVYNHRFLLSEIARILESRRGRLIGFVPFLIGYHPDPHDYFRYTNEALQKLLAESGFDDIRVRVVGGSPILAAFNLTILSLPRVLRPIAYLLCAFVNKVFIRFRPQAASRAPLGYIFTAQKL